MVPRKFERFSVDGMVTLVGDSVRGGGHIDNLSLGGAAIASDVPVTRGDYLQLTMTLPSQPAAVDVELAPVRWVKDHSFGVEFIRMSARSLQILQHYIEDLGLVPDEPASSNL
jgi:hypothetical protein